MKTTICVLGGLASFAVAQFPPKPSGVTTLKSKFHENVTISYKEPGICETTPGVKSYSGYVHLPSGFLDDGSGEPQDYPINTFFWFFEARKNPETAPLAIWLNGGPGGSSLMGLLEENGPCFVNSDSRTTRLNPWSWNNEVNMLYLDQPTQVGFSYDVPTNCTMYVTQQEDGPDWVWVPTDFTDGVPETNLTYHLGTFSSQNLTWTANTTAHAAHALWHFAQTWFFEFPYYKPLDDRISFWAESYGGHYGPGFVSFFQQQNEKIANGSAEEGAQYLHIDTLGIVNGLLDYVIQGEAYIDFPYNNTYGIQVFNQSLYEELKHNWTMPGGCKDRMIACQDALKRRDGLYLPATSTKENLTKICGDLDTGGCGIDDALRTYEATADPRGWYDIGHPAADPFPPPTMHGYLTQESVLSALGVPVNHSSLSEAVSQNFVGSYDIVHGGFLDAVGYLLDTGVKVHMMYGDRDYACNWVGGERASLAVNYSRSGEFAAAGYTPLLTSAGVGGMTRQVGNYSFSRVFQAGHEVPSYQPAAAYDIFMRATFGRDVPTGLLPVVDGLVTVGPRDTWLIKNVPPEMPTPRCNILVPGKCRPEVWEKVMKGEVEVKDFFVVEDGEEDEVVMTSEEEGQEVMGEL